MAYKLIPEKAKPSITKANVVENIARVPLQGAVGIGAALPGAFGNIFKGINDIAAAPLTKAITGSSIPYEETTLGKFLPTTQEHQRRLQQGIPYLKPKNKIEKYANDVAADTTELFLPGKAFKMGKYAFSPLRSLGISILGNTAGQGVTEFSGDKNKGDAVKSATMLAASLFSPQTAKKAASDLYKQASSILPEGANVSTKGLNANLSNLQKKVLQGREKSQLADSEKFVIEEIDKVRKSSSKGTVDVSTLIAMKRSLNETLQKMLFDLKDRSSKAKAKELAKNINGFLQNSLQEYGKTNPQWWKLQSSADKAFGAISKSNFVSRVLENYMKGRSEVLPHLFGIGIPAAVGAVSPFAGATAAAGYLTAKIGTQLAKSPELRKHYAKVVGAALADNPKVIQKELDEMEKEIQKQIKPRYRLKD